MPLRFQFLLGLDATRVLDDMLAESDGQLPLFQGLARIEIEPVDHDLPVVGFFANHVRQVVRPALNQAFSLVARVVKEPQHTRPRFADALVIRG